MVEDTRSAALRADSPLESPEDDRLGYAPFADDLAETITTRVPSDGYTIGVYGQWGSGKSTILNFVESQLSKTDSTPAVVRFNPWWFSGRGDLVDKFLDQMGSTLESDDRYPDIRSKLVDLSSALSKIPIGEVAGVPVDPAFAILHRLLQQEGENIDEIKNGIHEDLENADNQIIVIIDDIDRLMPREISLMFQLIKSIADFPNVVYILAFDREVVVNALKKEGNIEEGGRYLQKIVQLPLHIPKHKHGALESLLLDQLIEIPGDYSVETQRWESLLSDGLLPLLSTPREVIRLLNTVEVMCASVGDEVNFVDLVGLEALRVFHNQVYEEIKSSPERFVGHRRPSSGISDDPDQFTDVLNDLGSNREAVERILTLLFPMVRDSLRNQRSTFGDWNQMRVDKRICHRDRIPVYFRLSIPDGEISSTEMGAIMSNLDDANFLTEKLTEMLDSPGAIGGSKANTFIRRLDDRVDEIDPDEVASVVNSVFSVGDRLIQTQEINRHREMRKLSFLVISLLRQQEAAERVNTLSEGIQSGDSPYLASRLIELLLREHGEHGAEPSPEEDRLFDMGEIEELKPSVASSVQGAAENSDLLDIPWLVRPLDYWAEWGDADDTQKWVDDIISEDSGLLSFIDAMSSLDTVNWNTPVYTLDPRWLDDYVDREMVQDRLNSLDQGELDEDQKEIVERYKKASEILDDGRDPGTVDGWMGW